MTGPSASAQLPTLEREQVVYLGVWMFLATVAMLFAAFTSAYIVRRAGSDWRPIALPGILWLNSLVLGASSVAAEVGHHAAVRRRWTRARAGFVTAMLLGLGFLGGQTVAWHTLVREGVFVMTLPHASFFYLLTGLHAVHLAVGLVVLTSTLPSLRPDRESAGGDVVSPAGRARLAATFWHFFGGLWLYVFLLLSLR